MNKHLHRIVFNAARGMRMVVQETARSAGKATGATSAVVATALAGKGEPMLAGATRAHLVELARRMLSDELSFFEGAAQLVALRGQIEGLPTQDEDFDVFLLIYSETDHLPLSAQRHLWSVAALAEIESELALSETWARSFAESACRSLIGRFGS
jgi:hypothetical protein